MESLFKTKFNWLLFMLVAVIIRLLFVQISWLSYAAVMISLFQFILLFNAVGHVIPVRYLLGSFMCLQFFLGPALVYNGLQEFQYKDYWMKVPEDQYFLYVIPAVCLFIVGLHLGAGRLKGEMVDENRVKIFVQKNPRLPYFFIVLGFLSSVVAGFFGAELGFVFYLLGSFKFIGLFLLVLGSKQIKVWPLTIVIGSIVSSSLGEGMFHDLLTWVIFSAAVFGIKYKFSFKIKMVGTIGFLMLAVTIQILKGSYRASIGKDKDAAGLETFAKLADSENKDRGLFSFEKLASSVTRINQGFIITNIMITVPEKEPYADGQQMLQLLEAGILPRILAPNKLKAGDRAIFIKYSGIGIQQGTSMGLSSVGDAYVNFGPLGGAIFMFCLGFFYNLVLKMFNHSSKSYPILILFTTLVFYYPIRPDCELQTIFGHLFKSIFLIVFIINVWKHQFYVRLFKKPLPVQTA